MATPPIAVPVTPTTTGTVSSFLKLHERLIIVLVFLGLAFFGYGKYVNYMAARDTAKAQVTAQVLQTQVTQNATLAQQAAQNAASYQALLAQVTAQNQQLTAALATRNTQTIVQQKADTTLPLPDLATRWTTLAGLPAGGLKPSTDGLDVPADSAVKTVQQLELILPLQQNAAALTSINTNLNQQITAENTVVDGLNNQIVGLNKTVTDEQANTKAQVTACQANARKSKLKLTVISFGVGYVAGFVSKIFIK